MKCCNLCINYAPLYTEGSQVIIKFPHKNVFISLTISFVISNSVDPDEMLHYAEECIGDTHFKPKYAF